MKGIARPSLKNIYHYLLGWLVFARWQPHKYNESGEIQFFLKNLSLARLFATTLLAVLALLGLQSFLSYTPSTHSQVSLNIYSFIVIGLLWVAFWNICCALIKNDLQRRQMYQEAQASNRAKDDFLAVLSHEMRTPLNVVEGWVQMLRTEKMNTQQLNDVVKILDRNVTIQKRLMKDLLEVSSIIAGKFTLEKSKINLNNLLKECVDALKVESKMREVALSLEIEYKPVHVDGDRERLQQMIFNLISNALKFTPSGGQVTVSLTYTQNFATLLVKDTGHGIDPAFLPFVFDRFCQESKGPATNRGGGLGLGLAIVQHIVHTHGGSVRAESQGKNKGACFTVTLPIIHSTSILTAEPTTIEMKKDFVPSLKEIRILLVDDSDDVLALLTLWFEKEGALVSAATSVAQAMEHLPHFRPHILVSDIGMPGEDGYSLIQKLRALPTELSNIPALAVTAFVRRDEIEKALQSGFNKCLSKPVDAGLLVHTVSQLVQPEHSELRN